MKTFVQLLLLCSSIVIALTLPVEFPEDTRNDDEGIRSGGGGGGGGGGGASGGGGGGGGGGGHDDQDSWQTTAAPQTTALPATTGVPTTTIPPGRAPSLESLELINDLLPGLTPLVTDSEIRAKRSPNYYGGGGYGHEFGRGYGGHHHHRHHGYGGYGLGGNGFGGYYG